MIGWESPEQAKGYWIEPSFKFPNIVKPLKVLLGILGVLAIVAIIYIGAEIKPAIEEIKIPVRLTLSENLDKWQEQAQEVGKWPIK